MYGSHFRLHAHLSASLLSSTRQSHSPSSFSRFPLSFTSSRCVMHSIVCSLLFSSVNVEATNKKKKEEEEEVEEANQVLGGSSRRIVTAVTAVGSCVGWGGEGGRIVLCPSFLLLHSHPLPLSLFSSSSSLSSFTGGRSSVSIANHNFKLNKLAMLLHCELG